MRENGRHSHLAGVEHTAEDVFGELGISALGEAMNQFVGGIGRDLGEHTGQMVSLDPPRVCILDRREDLAPEGSDLVIGREGMIGSTTGHLFWVMTSDVVATLMRDVTHQVSTPPAHGSAQASPTAPTHATATDLGRLADMKLDVAVELGRSQIPIQELLALDEGGAIRLGRRVGEPVDLMVNGLATARGEIVVVDGRLGLRVTELIA
jgi:flagellar motor switch protein FliN/FliY